MCGIAGYSLRPRSARWADAGRAGAARRDRRAGRRCRRLRLPGPGRRLRDRREAAHAGLAAARARVRARRSEPAARPRARLHEGASVDLRQQPPGASRAGGRDPQRDHPQRRRAPRPPLLRPRRAADDRRLGGDLRDRRPLAERRARARAPARRDGHLLARRARAGRRLRRPRQRPPALDRRVAATASSSPRRRSRSRSSSATARLKLRKRELREGTWLALQDGRIVRRARFRPDVSYHEDDPLPSVRAPQEREFCLTRLAALAAAFRRPPSAQPTDAVGADVRRPPRAAARGRGTGTSPRRRGAPRTGGRPATRSAARRPRGAPPASRRTSAAGRAGARARLPWSTARSSRSSPTATSKPASRSAVASEPNVCQ